MSSPGNGGENPNPFQGIFGDIARILGGAGSGPLNWDIAKQTAMLIAGEGASEPNVDPIERIKLEEYVRLAQLHVEQRTELSPVIRSVETLNHIDWTSRTLDDYRSLMEKLAESLSRSDSATGDQLQGMDQLAQMEKFLGPVLMGMQVGGMVGHLSRRFLGQFDLPIPRRAFDKIVLIPANINTFAGDWSLPKDELSLYVAIEEVTRTAVLALPHVHERLVRLMENYVACFEPDSQALQERLNSMDLVDPSQITGAIANPDMLLGMISTPAQAKTLAELRAFVAVFVGYVDHVVRSIAPGIIPSAPAIAEANKRRRVEETDGNRIVERLMGLEMHQAQYDRGEAFVNGVLERSGTESLERVWRTEREMPTPADVDAPGLWLERIDLPTD